MIVAGIEISNSIPEFLLSTFIIGRRRRFPYDLNIGQKRRTGDKRLWKSNENINFFEIVQKIPPQRIILS